MSKISIGTPSGVEKRDMTAEEEALRTADIEQAAAEETAKEEARVAKEAEEAQKATDKANAKAKLLKIGQEDFVALTEAEADAILI